MPRGLFRSPMPATMPAPGAFQEIWRLTRLTVLSTGGRVVGKLSPERIAVNIMPFKKRIDGGPCDVERFCDSLQVAFMFPDQLRQILF